MTKIIIVEDELIIRKGLYYSIDWASIGCVVVGEASNGVEGLKLIQNTNPDIVILDINMPIMDGLTMLRKAKEHNLEFESIILSVHDEFEYAQKAIDLGSCAYILKPVNHQEIIKTINKVQKKIQLKLTSAKEFVETHQNFMVFPLRYANDHLIEKINCYLEENFQKKLLLDDVAQELRVSTNYINTKLKKTYNMTFSHYLTKFRLQKSIIMLLNTDLPIYEISLLSGFSEYKYFSSIFLKHVGVSPRTLKETFHK